MYSNLLKWSKETHNNLPWRKNRTVYKTLVSEIMLQQTTVGTVQNHFDRFLKIYPNIKALANSTEDEICVAWKGLGYYRRARNLRKAAIDIVENFNGKIPRRYEELVTISGIGEYTANAILSIGQDQQALSIDANIERVISRLYGIQHAKGAKLQKLIKNKFVEGDFKEIYNHSPRAINEALMDLGRIYCQARAANCLTCPMKKKCVAAKSGAPLEYPEIPVKKVKKSYDLSLLRVIVKNKNSILGYMKEDTEWLSGQVECPTFIIESEDNDLKQYPYLKNSVALDELVSYKTTITKYKITNYILELNKTQFKAYAKHAKDKSFEAYELGPRLNISTATSKALEKIC